ncbi:hypothetical protein N7492_007337 [Penicillium capsulatum]|uniref:Uncharacterized protein n=1 Tax=Penicillium capsulatum TaxID=69766 RepID=A0A9W9LL77_9EURO|nr:hypothetical protein N7492_007337 [Penicillium capsulatum]KAJ6117177.1 hypothetical protein N7512_006902 [Penicillium capsulatum]
MGGLDKPWPSPTAARYRPVRRSRGLLYLTLGALLLLVSYRLLHGLGATKPSTLGPRKNELVLATMLDSEMSWVQENLPEWRANIYRVDALPEEASLTVPTNKGREAMPFLTYLIDRYDTLPEIVVFLHADRYQWHNDNPLYDTVISVNDLQLDYVRESGYVNLRCAGHPGCPAELEPARYLRDHGDDIDFGTPVQYPRKFQLLLPGVEVPEFVGVPCCAQFAVTRDRVRQRGRSEYERMRRVVMESELDDETTGRIFEYLWHIVFGKPAQSCPDLGQCYCNTYGYCNMTDVDIMNQWQWRGATLPRNWPNVPGAPGYRGNSDEEMDD